MSKIRRPQSVTDSVAEKFLSRHLPYEIQMMRGLYPELTSGRYPQLIHNSNIESFLIHARNLIEFFKNKKPCDFDPRLFTKTGYEPDGNFIDSGLEAKINQQISHLTAARTDDPTHQLGQVEWKKILTAVEEEIKRFEDALTPEGLKIWRTAQETMAFVASGTGASSHVSTSHSFQGWTGPDATRPRHKAE